MSCISKVWPRRRLMQASALRIAVSMPRASTSTLSSPTASRSSLSHSITVRSGMEAFSTGTMRESRPRVRTKPPVERQQMAHRKIVGRQPHLGEPFRRHLAAIPPLVVGGDYIDRVGREAESLAHVADRRARPVGHHGGSQSRSVTAVLLVEVLDHFLAPLVLEVDVDVGRFIAFLRDEALKKDAHAFRIDFGDAQAVADNAIGRRAPA